MINVDANIVLPSETLIFHNGIVFSAAVELSIIASFILDTLLPE
jgi:hypothetical protein